MFKTIIISLVLTIAAMSSQASRDLSQKLFQMHINMSDLYLVPEYWDIPPQLIKAFKANLAASLKNEVELQVSTVSVAPAEVEKTLASSKIILLGDSHNDVKRHAFFAALIDRLSTGATQKIITTVEIIGPEHQGDLDRFIAGGMNVDQLKKAIDYDNSDFRIYPFEGYAKILNVLQKHKIRALAVYKPVGTHYADLKTREKFVYETVEKEFALDRKARLILVYGGWHLLGENTLTDRFAPQYRDQMVHYLTGFEFPELRILLSRPKTPDGTVFMSKLKNVKTYYQKFSFNPRANAVKFTDFFEYGSPLIQDPAVRERFLALAPIMVDTYERLMESFVKEPQNTLTFYLKFCNQAKDIYKMSMPLMSHDRLFMKIFAPRLKKFAQCDLN